MEARTRRVISRGALATLMVATGVLHLVVPEPYVRIIPRWLPPNWARPLVAISGVAQVLTGVGLLHRRTRRIAAWALTALLVAVFPANVEMALDRPGVVTWLRLPLQPLLVWWAWLHARRDVPAPETGVTLAPREGGR